ncbi:helix-turn-helix domain-containing protein [Sphingosinicella sp. LHD-64]|uniref:helix-turn-helix domain-containing protein n=1 Tax=Sphingosinicella sp. LHD-64 TaxID=3072139 RepID=UPI00280D57DA|nr:helix-turn-helix domain-containing protein [Sphingosinicella sp. LHD-64]MDQ8755907.1 helix-turn-helix domain-containing protein [Sphingosinicella sp. LHD-64]
MGTLLRRLIEHLDGAVEASYTGDGLDYRPRYTPIVRALVRDGPATIRDLAARTGVSHSAASQTVAQMAEHALVTLVPGADARERIVAAAPALEAMLPQLERRWAATEAAARSIDTDLGLPLADVVAQALDALECQPFADRIRQSEAVHPET